MVSFVYFSYKRWGILMIQLTKLSGQAFTLNSDLIETIEAVPDTVMTMTTGTKYIVKESIEEIKQKVIEHKQKILVVLHG